MTIFFNEPRDRSSGSQMASRIAEDIVVPVSKRKIRTASIGHATIGPNGENCLACLAHLFRSRLRKVQKINVTRSDSPGQLQAGPDRMKGSSGFAGFVGWAAAIRNGERKEKRLPLDRGSPNFQPVCRSNLNVESGSVGTSLCPYVARAMSSCLSGSRSLRHRRVRRSAGQVPTMAV